MEEFQKIGKYEIKARLGEGGMGVVYQAWDPDIQRPAAIKLMSTKLARNPEIRERFLREARACGILQHPHIVVVYEFGECNDAPYIAMEYLNGVSLAKIIEALMSGSHILPLPQRVEIIVQVLQALDYAHRSGIIHRDIKPANIMVLDDGNAKLVDFGIAHLTRNTITPAGAVMGTYQYMSPEQLRGDKIDGRSDVYSTAVALYELLALDLPFEMDTPVQFMQNVLAGRMRELRQFLPSVPLALNDVMRKALAVDRNARYATAGEFASDLQMVKQLLEAPGADPLAATVVRPSRLQQSTQPVSHPSVPPPPSTPPPAPSHPQITPPSHPQFIPPPPQPQPSFKPLPPPPYAPQPRRTRQGNHWPLWMMVIGIPILAIAGIGIWKSQQPAVQPQPTPIPVPVVMSTPSRLRHLPTTKQQNGGTTRQQNKVGASNGGETEQTYDGGDNNDASNTVPGNYGQVQQPTVVNPALYAGVWQATMSDGYRVYNCFITDNADGTYVFANSCPLPFAGETGRAALYTNGTWRLQATNRRRFDQGTYQASGNHNHMQGTLGAADWYRVR